MNMKAFLLSLLFALPAAAGIVTIGGTWTDAERSREIPYRIYAPQDTTGRCPVIIFSHGLGGTCAGYGYLGSFWASNGYVSIHLQHHGSDDAVWRGAKNPMQDMRRAATDPRAAMDRPRDVTFAIDRLPSLETNAVLRGRIDTNRIGVAGHSFGAFTALSAAGQKFGLRGRSLGDSRIKAAVAMSAPVPRGAKTGGYDGIRIPVLHMTGTKDVSPISDTKAEERRVPFDMIAGVDQYLVNFNGGDHMIFSGVDRQALAGAGAGAAAGRTGNTEALSMWREHARHGDAAKDEAFHALIRTGTLAFWDAYLRDNAKAKAWLQDGGYAKELGDAAALETKKAVAAAPRDDGQRK